MKLTRITDQLQGGGGAVGSHDIALIKGKMTGTIFSHVCQCYPLIHMTH